MPILSSGGVDPRAAVDSVFGRAGAVTATSGDYTAAQVGAVATGAAAGGDLSGTFPNPTVGAGKITPAKLAIAQAAIPDLNLGVLTLLTDVITAVGTIQTKVNVLLAELRTAGVLTP